MALHIMTPHHTTQHVIFSRLQEISRLLVTASDKEARALWAERRAIQRMIEARLTQFQN